MRIHGWISGLIGVWITITGFLSLSPNLMFWSTFIAGAILFIISIQLTKTKLIGWLLFHLGLWLILMAWIPGFQSGALKTWSHVLTGIVVMLHGFGSLRIPARYPSYEFDQHAG